MVAVYRLRTLGPLLMAASFISCASPPPANPPTSDPEADQAEPDKVMVEAPPAVVCDAYAFSRCTSACASRECLDWCAGTSCVDLAAELYACAIPGEKRYLDEHPEPIIEEIPPGPDADPDTPDYERIDPESEERYYQWEVARDDAMREHWEDRCVPKCAARLQGEGDGDAEFSCHELELAAYRWSRYAPPPPPTSSPKDQDRISMQGSAGILGVMSAQGGAFGLMSGLGMFGGSSLRLDYEAAKDFDHGYALGELIRNAGPLGDLSSCVPSMRPDSKPEQFKLTLTFDVHGGVDDAVPQEASRAGECVAERVAQVVRLPEPALRGLPVVQVDVSVAPQIEMSDVWGGLEGAAVGEAYGAGGLGLVGSGRGGGGSGEGSAGVGSIGSIGRGGGGGGYGSASSSPRDDSSSDEGSD